jgi:hypothetical protein
VSARSESPGWFSEPLKAVATVAAGAASFVVVVYVLGGIVMAIRYAIAGVPVTAAVSYTNPSLLLTVGMGALLAPWVILTVFVLGSLAPVWHHSRRPVGLWTKIAVLAVASVYLGFVIVMTPPTLPALARGVVAGLWIVTATIVAVEIRKERKHLHRGSALLVSGVLALTFVVVEQWVSARDGEGLDWATAATSSGDESGVLLGFSSGFLHLGQDGQITAIPTSDILRVTVSEFPGCVPVPRSFAEWALGWRVSHEDCR